MKMKTAILAMLAIPFLATFANGQNLFRTGRPNYARGNTGTYHDRYTSQATSRDLYRDDGYGSFRQDSLDRERARQVWENDQHQTSRYPSRYGASTPGLNSQSPYGASSYRPRGYRPTAFDSSGCNSGHCNSAGHTGVRPIGFDRDSRQPRRCNRLPYDRYDEGRISQSRYDRNSNYDGDRSYRPNLNRSAALPLTSLFDSLFGTNR